MEDIVEYHPIHLENVKKIIKGESLGLMLFGSYARGDYDLYSDIDVLQLTHNKTERYQVGNINISTYSKKVLEQMSEEGSMFVLHLLTEGQVLEDNKGAIKKIFEKFEPMGSREYNNLRQSLLRATQLIDVNRGAFGESSKQYINVASFILRSTLYSLVSERGAPTFSINLISEKFKDKDLLLLKDIRVRVPNYEDFLKLKNLIAKYLGKCIDNNYGSLEALILNSKSKKELTYVLGLRLLKGSGKNEIYNRVI